MDDIQKTIYADKLRDQPEQAAKTKKKRNKRRKKQKMIVSHSLFTLTSQVVNEEIKGESKSSSSKENVPIKLMTDIEKAQINE